MVREVSQRIFRLQLSTVLTHLLPEGEALGPHHLNNLIFGDYMIPDAETFVYDEVSGSEAVPYRLALIRHSSHKSPNKRDAVLQVIAYGSRFSTISVVDQIMFMATFDLLKYTKKAEKSGHTTLSN